MSKSGEDRINQAMRGAFERYVLDLMRVLAVEQETVHRANRGDDLNVLIRDVKLIGEYPKTSFELRKYDRVRDQEWTRTFPLYGSPDFFDEKGNRLVSPERIVGDTLMWARGG